MLFSVKPGVCCCEPLKSIYKGHISDLNFTDISFPVKIDDIPKFETQNDVFINIFGYEKNEIFPVHITTHRFERQVNLLMISDNRNNHYCWIKDLSRLLGDQHTNTRRYHYCPYCLHGLIKERLLEDHIPYCQTHGSQKIVLPNDYKEIRKQLKVPYVIYADFESLLIPIKGCENDPEISSTIKTTKHIPCRFAYKVVDLTSETSKQPVVYRGLDAAEKVVEHMVMEQEDIEQKFKHCEPMKMS